MTADDQELYPIAHSTAYLGLAALLTIRENGDDDFDAEAVDYATRVLAIIKATPETVLMLPASDLEDIGPVLLDNSHTWLDDE
jgi:hypothetical protein